MKPASSSSSIEPPPGAGLVEDEHLVAELLEPLARRRHAGVVTPNIEAAISGCSSPSGAPCACAMPASAPAAFVMIRAEIRLIPAMSTTEYIIVTSTEPTYGLVSPEATVDTISFGTPIGSCAHRVGRERRAARAAEAADRVEPPLVVQPLDDLGRAARHRLDRGAAVAGGGERIHVRAGRGGDLLAGHVRLGERLADDAGIDEHDVDACASHALAQKGVLLALRVERADENDGGHGLSSVRGVVTASRGSSGSTPR